MINDHLVINNDDQVRWYSEKIVGIPLACTIEQRQRLPKNIFNH